MVRATTTSPSLRPLVISSSVAIDAQSTMVDLRTLPEWQARLQENTPAAVHTDVPEFRGANRKVIPQWLLVVMHHAGLFESWRMPIATGIAYFAPAVARLMVSLPGCARGSEAERLERSQTEYVELGVPTELAARMVREYGMSRRVGPVALHNGLACRFFHLRRHRQLCRRRH